MNIVDKLREWQRGEREWDQADMARECLEALDRPQPEQPKPAGDDWITDDMTGIAIIDQVRMMLRFQRIEDAEAADALEVALSRLSAQPAQGEPKYTTGHCENHKQPGGCHLHNLHCRYPECDRKPAQGEGEK